MIEREISLGYHEAKVDGLDGPAPAPRTPVTVVNWYDTRANIAALLRWFDSGSTVVAANIVEKPWTYDSQWDAYQATLPEAQRWRGSR